MTVSWAKGIAITEPAPRPARLARYLAPHWRGLTSLETEDGIGMLPAVVAVLLASGAVFGGVGGAAAYLGSHLCGGRHLVWWWTGIDVLLALALAASYWLVGRYGLRFYDADPTTNGLWRLVTVGNSAWRCLPRHQRKAQRPRLRALNTTARLLLTEPDDANSWEIMAVHAAALRHLSTTVLNDSAREVSCGTVTLEVRSAPHVDVPERRHPVLEATGASPSAYVTTGHGSGSG
ncbi:hypothetical protein [Streptomyces sp. ODS28]|uniref:hypothetical protein n=1 Tax=Streptomyces sp. ODS28 TaxID=3136688 RepID=UPI0031F166D2